MCINLEESMVEGAFRCFRMNLHFDDVYYRRNRKRLIVHRNVRERRRVSRFWDPVVNKLRLVLEVSQ